ncbi:MAG TPA: hypothetical protein VJQ43_02850 [Thermoplasmata archaeon]|nr:hypothetical protein [Thermoplasmata archaeon]
MVYLVGFLLDIRAHALPFAVDAVVLALVVAVMVLAYRWWDPRGTPVPRPRIRVFLALGGLALAVQIVGVVLEASDPGDLGNNAPAILLLAVLFLNCLS